MGVHGLWQLLHPAGQPVTLESLEGKVLAVDISIWLHQTMKGMRDKDGNPLPNAHLQGLFFRICKLLFYRIKPIFVFDGDVPALKKQTMAARRERRAEAERESNEISQKLLQNLIKSQAVRQTLGDIGSSHRHVPGVKRGRNQPDRDMFELAPLAESEEIGLALNAEEWDRDFELQKSWIKEGLAAVSDSHPDSEEFRSLPAEIQHEVLSELKEQKKYHSLSRINKMPEDSTDFSSYQLKKLMRQSKLTAQIDEVRKQMTSNTAGDIACSLVDEYHGDEVEARRIVSEDAAHYVLIKGLTKKRQQEEADRYEIHSRVKLEKIDPEDSDNTAERLAGDDHILMVDTTQPGHIDAQVKSSGIISSDSDSDFNNYINSRLQEKRRQKSKPTRSGIKTDLDPPAPVYDNNADHIVSECEVVYSNRGQLASSDICTSEDEGFIEVRIDPSAAVEDDLFPASVFQTDINRFCRDPTAAVNEQHPENVSSASSDLIQAKNTLMELNSFEKLSTGLAEGDSQEKLGDVASCGADFGERTDNFSHQASETDDVIARRKNVLNEILKQLEQKKKSLSDSHLDDCGDTSLQISKDETRRVNRGSDVGDSLIVKKLESKHFVSQYGGASCSKTLSPGEAQDSSGGFLINTLEESNSLSESDEELKIAIELSLQANRPENNMCLQTADCSPSGSLENSASTNLLKHHNVENTASALLKLKEVDKESHTKVTFDLDNDTEDFVEVESEQILIENLSITGEGGTSADSETDVQEDTDADKNQDSGEFTRTVTHSSESFHNQLHSPAMLEKQPVESSSNLLQPEDYGIDNYEMFQIMDQSNLEDVRTRLESERSALMSERGRHTRMATSITEQTNLEAQELLQLFGIPFIVSPMEAEAQCAYLDITNQTAGTITDDSDIWLFGGRRMYKNFFNQSKHVELYTYDSIYSHFGINRTQLINIALLCGSDYTEGIQGVGPVRALEIMAEFPGDGLEGLYSFRNWWSRATSQTFTSGNKVRARLKDLKVIPGFPSEAVVDAYLHPQVDDSTEKFTWGLPDLDLLREFTKYKFGWSKEKADQSLLPMMKQLSKNQSQGRIHMYFQPRHLDKTSKIQSERLKRALASMRNSRQILQEGDQKQDNIGDSNHAENALEGHTTTKKRKAIENREDSAGSPSKLKTARNKPVKQAKKKKVATVEAVKEGKLTLVEKQVDITEVVATLAKAEPEVLISEVMKDDTEKFNIEDTVKERVNVDNTTVSTQKQVEELKRMTLTKGKKNKPIFTEKKQILSREGKRKEKTVTVKKNHSHKKFDVKSDASQKVRITIDKDESRRGRRLKGDKYVGQGRLPVSLDEKQITRSKHFTRGKPSRGRGIVNLSESSSSASDGGSANEQSGIGEFDITRAKQSHHSKTMLSSAAGKGTQEQVAELQGTQHNKAVDTQISERGSAGVTDPTASQCNQLSFAGKKIDQEFLNTDLTTDILPVVSTELTHLKPSRTSGKPDSFAGSEETVSKIADVSIINRQNLSSTLSYLNRRSREDTFLLHQLKGSRTVNVVEKRLEEHLKKSVLEKQSHLNIGQTDEQIVSFEDVLSGLDVVTSKSVQDKGKIIASDKKLSTVNVCPVKALQNKIFQQIGQFGSALLGTSSNDISDSTSIKQPDSHGHPSNKGNHSQEIIHMIQDEKQPLVKSKHQITNKQHLTGRTASDEQAVGTCNSASFGSSDISESCRQIKKVRAPKSSRSYAFDKPIGENSSGDYDSDREARKLSKKKRFLKQVEHVGDSKSVKGFGILPRQNAEQTIRIEAGKGIGMGKKHTNDAGISQKLESKNASEEELLEYAFITADDLGSDFSDLDA
ncbi:hypothetical protein BsWGS_03244 [Bradybaena similaris]